MKMMHEECERQRVGETGMRMEGLNHLGGLVDWGYQKMGYCSIPLEITGPGVYRSVNVRWMKERGSLDNALGQARSRGDWNGWWKRNQESAQIPGFWISVCVVNE
jgi:hypothetical protein